MLNVLELTKGMWIIHDDFKWKIHDIKRLDHRVEHQSHKLILIREDLELKAQRKEADTWVNGRATAKLFLWVTPDEVFEQCDPAPGQFDWMLDTA